MNSLPPPVPEVTSLPRVQLWSCGGGRQSAGVAAMIIEGSLPRPDAVVMTRLPGEIHSTWPYVNEYIRPAMEKCGVPFHEIQSVDFATKGLWGGSDGASILLPVYSSRTEKGSKLPEYCSGEWKREVVARWAAKQSGWKDQGVDNWIGIPTDEFRRRRAPRRQWLKPTYPLLDVRPSSVQGCLDAVRRVGWPPPPRSRCYFCPNQSDREWLELTEDELKSACNLDEEIRLTDPHAWLHKSKKPLRQVEFDKKDKSFSGGCKAGTCF